MPGKIRGGGLFEEEEGPAADDVAVDGASPEDGAAPSTGPKDEFEEVEPLEVVEESEEEEDFLVGLRLLELPVFGIWR